MNAPVEPPSFDHPDFLALLERARKAETASTPRKHHLVPAFYLRYWAEEGQIRVTDVNTGRTFLTSPEKAARETDYYRVESEDIDPEFVPPLLFELFLSEVEGWGKQVIEELRTRPAAELDVEKRGLFARFVALQYTRGQLFRQERRQSANDLFKMSYEHITDEGIRMMLKRRGTEVTSENVDALRRDINDLQEGRLYVAPQDAALVGQAVNASDYLGEELFTRRWIVYRTPPVLVTCDEPVVAIGGPGLPRNERPGIAKAGVIAFPLAPDAVLTMFRRDLIPTGGQELDHAETAELNREILAHAARWAFERPFRNTATQIGVPPAPEPTAIQRFVNADRPNEEIVRTYRPNRWVNTNDPPAWPVAKWWAGGRS